MLEVDGAGELVELGKLIDVPEHLIGILDDLLDEPSQCCKALRPRPALGVRGEQTREVLHEPQQVPRLVDALGEPFGSALSLALLVLARDQRAKTPAPLVKALDDPGASRRRLPLRRSGRCRIARASPSGATRP